MLIGGDVAILPLPQLTVHPLVDQNLPHTYSNKICHLQEKYYLEFTHSNVEVLGNRMAPQTPLFIRTILSEEPPTGKGYLLLTMYFNVTTFERR